MLTNRNSYTVSAFEEQQNASTNQITLLIGILAMVAGILFVGVNLKKTETWRPTIGVVTANDLSGKTITYGVGKARYTTKYTTALQVLAARHNIPLPNMFISGSTSVSTVNGVDPEIGKQSKVYYNPVRPHEAATTKGMTPDFFIPILCLLAVSVIHFLASCGGWDVGRRTGYTSWD